MGARGAGRAVAVLGGVVLAVGLPASAASGSRMPLLPVEEAYETVVEGSDVTLLDPVTFEQRTGVDVSVEVRVHDDAEAGQVDDDTAVRVSETTARTAEGTLLSTTTTTACLDRRTREAVDCPVEAVDGRRVDVRGLTLAFPPGAAAQDRMMWDDTAEASFPVRLLGTERFHGLEVQRFEHRVPEQVLRAVTVPGLLVGSPEATAPADVLYGTTRFLLVEPVSGVVVASEDIRLTRLRGADGTPGAVLLGGAFASSEESDADAVARARAAIGQQDGADGVLSWAAAGTGVALLGLGGLLVARGRALPAGQGPGGALGHPVPVS